MKQSKSPSKDPICGMTVDEETARRLDRVGDGDHACGFAIRSRD